MGPHMNGEDQPRGEAQKRVLIVDDHVLVSGVTAAALEKTGDFLCTCVSDVASAIACVQAEPFDVILLDVGLPGEFGVSGLQKLLAIDSGIPIILFSGNASDETISQGLSLGARGFIPKTLALRTAASALRLVCDGCDFVPMNHVLKPVESRPSAARLTGTETRMLELFSRGKSLKEVSSEFGISVSMTKNRARQIYRKLGSANRANAVLKAKNLQII